MISIISARSICSGVGPWHQQASGTTLGNVSGSAMEVERRSAAREDEPTDLRENEPELKQVIYQNRLSDLISSNLPWRQRELAYRAASHKAYSRSQGRRRRLRQIGAARARSRGQA